MIWFACYILTIAAANAAIAAFGLVPVGFGLMAPAGVVFAGLALTCRDFTQEALGRRWSVAAILVGAAFSWLISPAFALASATAFLVSELADYAAYQPLRERNWLAAVAASNTAGLVVDSALFLWLAFGSLEFLAGQVWAKLMVTVATVAVLWMVRRRQAVALVA